jgi:succinate-semialdehyde dehydrogenase/glutarate-semialdehyde dehydrogenase
MATATTHHYATVNPYTGEVVRESDSLDAAAVDRAVETAHRAFGAWRDRPIEERAAIVHGAGELLAEQRDRLAAPRPLESDAGDAVLLTEPLGPLLTVQPWNYPLCQVARIAAPNLVLGNTIVLKHVSTCPQSALALEEVFRDAGVPAGVFTNLFLETGDIAAVIESPRVHGDSLTRSEGAGAPVAEQAGRNIKKSVLELGGSDLFIVLDAEHLERTVDAAVKGRLHEHYDAFVSGGRPDLPGALWSRPS